MKQTPSNGPRRELALVIPALDPGRELPGLLARLRPDWAGPVVVVDDGSGRQAQAVFAAAGQLGATVLHHGGNRGKGAALKTALRYCRTAWPGLAGCVTADADGQHSAADILRVADALRSHPGSLVLGVRDFSAPGVPLRSRLGNRLMCGALRLACGLRLADTQTGLRGIPMDLVPELTGLPGSRYEFETAMLLAAQSAAHSSRSSPYRCRSAGLPSGRTACIRCTPSRRMPSLHISDAERTGSAVSAKILRACSFRNTYSTTAWQLSKA